MKKLIFIPFISVLSFTFCIGQQMIDFTKEWRISRCCYSLGMTDCTIVKCHFDSISTVIDGDEYHELLYDKPQSSAPKYFKEANGRVYFWHEDFGSGTPYLAYDFKAQVGEVVYVGVGEGQLMVEEIDSIALYDGTMRKRLKLHLVGYPNNYTYWIEGIGGTDGPMNPDYTFSFDCWSDLQCYRDSSQVLYSIGDCLLTPTINRPEHETKITLYPNPASEQITIKGLEEDLLSITIFDHLGRRVKTLTHLQLNTIDIKDLSKGVYLAALILKNGRKINTTFIVI